MWGYISQAGEKEQTLNVQETKPSPNKCFPSILTFVLASEEAIRLVARACRLVLTLDAEMIGLGVVLNGATLDDTVVGLVRTRERTAGDAGLSEQRRPDAFQLQPFFFENRFEAPSLQARVSGSVSFTEGEIRLEDEAELSFSAYLNSFYEAVWLQYTDIGSVGVALSGCGRFSARIFRATETGATLAGSLSVNLDLLVPATLWAEDARSSPGRLYLELSCEGAGVLRTLAWVTQKRPARDVKLGVGLCTAHPERPVAEIVAELLQGPAACFIEQVVLVNQGPVASRCALRGLVQHHGPRLHLIEQDNYGGAGGFTCGAMRLLESDCSHIVFMDDDVAFDARQLVTAVAFLRHTTGPIVLGGQMLDLFNPTQLFEAGARVADGEVRPNHRGLDVSRPETLTALTGPHLSDFNGWWLTIFPAACFREHGLPLPLFIHVDDVEYGTRLTEAGIPTVSLAPVSIWHEPFTTKLPGIYTYYDIRNWAIYAALYPHRMKIDGSAKLLGEMVNRLLRFDYLHLALSNRALQDYLRGPELFREPAPSIHARVERIRRRRADQVLTSAPEAPLATFGTVENRIARAAIGAAMVARLCIGRPKENAAGVRPIVPSTIAFTQTPVGRTYIAPHHGGRFWLHRSFRWSVHWSEMLATLWTILMLALFSKQARRRWRAEATRLASPQEWSKQLALETPAD